MVLSSPPRSFSLSLSPIVKKSTINGNLALSRHFCSSPFQSDFRQSRFDFVEREKLPGKSCYPTVSLLLPPLPPPVLFRRRFFALAPIVLRPSVSLRFVIFVPATRKIDVRESRRKCRFFPARARSGFPTVQKYALERRRSFTSERTAKMKRTPILQRRLLQRCYYSSVSRPRCSVRQ